MSRLARLPDFARRPVTGRSLAIVLALSLGPAILGIWSSSPFVSQDGPAHLYNAQLIVETTDPNSPYTAIYSVRHQPLPNWIGHILYLVLGFLLPAATAERAALTITLVAVAGTTAYLRRTTARDSLAGLIATAALSALIGLNVTWLFGFTGFLLGTSLFALTLALWWEGRDGLLPRRVWTLAGLIVVGYFCHPVSLGLTAFGLVTLAVLAPGAGPWGKRLVGTALALSPLVPLGILYRNLTRAGGPMRPEWGFLARPFSARSWVAQLGWIDPISLAAKVQRPWGTTPSVWNGLAAPVAWVAVGLSILVVVTLRDRGGRPNRRGWGLVALVLGLAGCFGPDTVGAAHGHYLPQRIILLALVALVPWLDLSRPGRLAGLGRAALVVALGLQSAFIWDYAEESRETAGGLVSAATAVPNGQRIAVVLLDTRGRFRSNPLLHADCLLGVGTGNVIWGDYETNHYYFPVQLRDPESSPPASALESIARLDGPENAEERARLWSDLLERYDDAIDVVLIWGSDPAIEAATARRYTRTLTGDVRVQVWVRGGLG